MQNSLVAPLLGIGRTEEMTAKRFDELVHMHRSRIYRVLWCQLRDADAAATLTQDCFLRAYQNRSAFRGECSVSTWLIRIALNLARDYQRNRRHRFWRFLFGRERTELETVAPLAPDGSASPERALLAREELAEVMGLVTSLAEQQRTAFMLRFIEEFSIDEIAQAMNVQPGTVKAHLSRAVGALRQRRAGRSAQGRSR